MPELCMLDIRLKARTLLCWSCVPCRPAILLQPQILEAGASNFGVNVAVVVSII